jgi:NADPH:quinone reductase-like Zn-dependent oxidoreductase
MARVLAKSEMRIQSKEEPMETMKAIRVHEYGGPEVLRYEEAPRPEPGPGEVLVRIRAAGVNPVDWKVREGYLKDALAYRMPFVPGWDVSGIVEAMGPNVTLLKRGDEVYGHPSVVRNGAYAEFAVIPEAELALKPRSIDHVLAASLPVAALTAWQGLFDIGGLRTEQKVLIHGGSGGVGSFAVQLARWKGAFIIATASGRNQEFLRNLGADLTIDYERSRFDRVVCDADVVFDTIGGETLKRSWKVLKRGGILVSTVEAPDPADAEAHRARGALVDTQANPGELAEIAKLVDAGMVRPIVEAVFPLPEARHAQELSQTGHARGKIVLQVA